MDEPILCEAVEPRPQRLPWYLRTVLAVAGAGAVSLLAVAAALTPSTNGYGTHQQLGLPECSFVTWFNSRCPACGMTTSWACLTKGRVLDALRANSGGALLALTAAVAGPWSLWSGLRGKWLWGPLNEKVVIVVAGSVLAVTLMDWCYRLLTR